MTWDKIVTITGLFVSFVAVVIAVTGILLERSMVIRLRSLVRQMSETEQRIAGLSLEMTKTQERISGLSQETYALLGFSKPVLSDDELREKFPELAQNYFCVYSENRVYLKTFLSQHLAQTMKLSRDAASGSLYIPTVSLIDYAVDLLSVAQEGDRVFATSFIKTPKFWDTAAAKRYLQEQERMIKNKNATVSRVFLYDELSSSVDARNVKEMTDQSAKGIQVYVGIASELEPNLRQDMLVIEGRLAAVYEMTTDREELIGVRVWIGRDEVQDRGRRMAKLIESSRRYVPASH